MLTDQAWRFLVTGVLNTSVHVATAGLLVTQVQMSLLASNVLAFGIATTFSYVINTLWSFSRRIDTRTMVRFACVSIAGLGLTAVVSKLAEWASLHYVLGILLVPFVVTPVTFLLHRGWTYSRVVEPGSSRETP